MAGAFDSLEGHRAQHVASLETIVKAAQSTQADRAKGQMNLFGAIQADTPMTHIELADVPEWPQDELLKNEKEQLGFYLSGHPLEQYEDVLKYYTTASSQTLAEHPNDTEVYVTGLISSVRSVKTKKKGEAMAILVVDDLEGPIDVVVFPEAYKVSMDAIEEGEVVWIRGNVSENRSRNGGEEDKIEEDVRQILAAEVLPITQVVNRLTSAVEITISETDVADQGKMSELQKICLQRRGDCDLILRLMSPKYGEIITRCGSRYNISYDSACISQIEDLFGGNSAKPSNRTSRVAERSPYSTINYA
jgi:DNA polymerase-3 subunit alpha